MTPDDIVELFSIFGPVTVRRMFGGAGIYADGTMFGLVADGVIYLKAGDGNVAMFECEQLAPFTFSKRTGDRVVTSYRRMPDRLYDDPEELAEWARAALTAARQRRGGQPPATEARPVRAKSSRAKSPSKKRAPAKPPSNKNRRGKKSRSR